MLSGFNTNFRYRGVLFHVQTEDSGLENPHVITHLFHGGNILASEKRDYSDRLGDADVEQTVRKLMEAQHKSMLKRLSRGEHDAVLRDRLGSGMFEADAATGPGADARSAPGPGADTPISPGASEPEPRVHAESPTVLNPGPAPATPAPVAEPPRPRARPHPPEHTEPTAPAAAAPEAAPDGGGSQAGNRRDRFARVFGEKTVSDRPLDEVVLDYLVENARKRKRPPK